MLTIGLPKSLFYFQHCSLWTDFFQSIGCNVVVSEDTNKEILDYGVKCCSNETCLPVKVFHGHVFSLRNKADYIFIPRYTSLDKNEYTCPKFCGLPDLTLLNLKKQVNIIEVKINMDKHPEEILESLRLMAGILKIESDVIVKAYYDAVEKYIQDRDAEAKLDRVDASNNSRLGGMLVLGHPYMIHDRFLSMGLEEKLNKRNITVYTPKNVKHEVKRRNAYPYQGKVFWDVGLDILGTAFALAETGKIKGVIYLTPFACGVDSFVMEFIERRYKSNYNIPLLKLTIDEHTGEAGFNTRLEAFLDMVG